jgi:DNA-binding winged helix-turn-helix (wHTH) protein/pimeloyl-ACP methyl ester carboxylesterase
MGANVQFLFADHRLDTGRRELKRGSELIALEPQVFDLLVYLLQNRDRVVSKDDVIAAVWRGRIVSESTLTSRINAVRNAVGDSGEEQRVIRTIARKGFRFVGEVQESADHPLERNKSAPTKKPAVAPAPRQEIHFCTAADGVRIAYAEVGRGAPLVRTGHWLTHLEFDWHSPVWSPFLHALAADHRLIRYDARGNGLSDWEVAQFSFEAFVNDLECVIDATDLKRFALLGASQGAAVSVAYAVRHPERVSHLILYGGFSRGIRRRGTPEEIEQADALLTLIRQGWGQENPAFRQIFTTRFLPGATAEQIQWFNDLQQKTTSPENAARIRKAVDEIDVSGLLSQVKVPTLVLHLRDDAALPFEEGRKLAAGIPGARFVALEGRNHIILKGDPSWDRFLDEIRNFLRQ